MSTKQDDGTRYFCRQTGVRLVAPGGVSKAVDPVNGVDEWDAPAPKVEAPAEEPAPALKAAHAKKEH